MNASPLAIRKTGLVTSVGLTAPAACAAMRAKISNPTETRFIGSSGEWIMAHQVTLEQRWRGLTKLAKMAAMVIDEAMEGIERKAWKDVPLLLCVAERDRPGRVQGLDDQLFIDVQAELGASFHQRSAVVSEGRIGVPVALTQARTLMREHGIEQVLIAATDSLLTWPTLSGYEREQRLLSSANSNGFMPGEGAGALLVSRPVGSQELVVTGLGFGVEKAHINAEEPLRAEGLSQAIKGALAEASIQMHDLDYRITDVSGEQYYFKEAALALSRTLRTRKETLDMWHPAESAGETGAAAGAAVIVLAHAACRRAFTLGPNVLAHMSNDGGRRAALTLRYQAAA